MEYELSIPVQVLQCHHAGAQPYRRLGQFLISTREVQDWVAEATHKGSFWNPDWPPKNTANEFAWAELFPVLNPAHAEYG